MIRDLIDDQTKLGIMTTKTIRKNNVNLFNGKIRTILHHISYKYYFGLDILDYVGIKVPVSDLKKTFMDLLYFKIKLSDIGYYELLRVLKKKKLLAYLKKYDRRFFVYVMGFLKK